MRNPQTNFDWSEANIERLKALFHKGHTYVEMGREMGVPKNAISSILFRIGLARKPQAVKRPAKPYPEGLDSPRSARECSWPIGDPGHPDFRFCGDPVAVKSYCADHAAIAYVPAKKRSEANLEGKTTMVFSSLQGRMVPKRMAGAK